MSAPSPSWGPARERALHTLARNLSTRYVSIVAEMAIGLLLLPFNLAYLGESNYGLWILLGSLTAHFSLLDMGSGSALVKFVAQYRAKNDARAINEIASTTFVAFGGIGVLAYGLVMALAFNLEHLFAVTAAQAEVGTAILLIIGIHVAVNFPFAVYGGVTGGFQRYDINNIVWVVTSTVAAVVNVAVVLAGGSLVTLVAATTGVRVLAYLVYAVNAHRVFPELKIRPALYRTARLREVMGFSVYTSVIDWANKLNYQLDEVIIGIFLGPVFVAVWAPAHRIIAAIQRLTNQVNGVLFPLIVDTDTADERRRLQQILLQGTRFSLAMVLPLAAAVFILADPLIRVWLRDKADAVAGAIPVLQILTVAVAIRVGNATGTTLLKGTGGHRLLAGVNLATGVVNVALSALLIQRYGLVGVAAGTLIPIAAAAFFVLFPASCRRVGLTTRYVLRHAVAPAVWPVVPTAALVWLLRSYVPMTFAGLAFEGIVAGLTYLLLFFGIAVGRRDRAFYFQKGKELAMAGGQ